jgi:hypothetical protein
MKLERLKSVLEIKQSVGLIVVMLATVLGVYFLAASHASTPSIALEPELGSVSAGALVVTDANASGGKAIGFSSGTPTTGTLFGAKTSNQVWYDANIGHEAVRAHFQGGWPKNSLWSSSAAAGDPASAVSHIRVIPFGWGQTGPSAPGAWTFAEIINGAHDADINTFIHSAPHNALLTFYKEPENDVASGYMTAAQFRQAQIKWAQLIRAANTADHAQRKAVIALEGADFLSGSNHPASQYWPGNDSSGKPWADVLGVDVYAPQPGNTGSNDPYTDGTKWKTPTQLFDPSRLQAEAWGVPFGVAEFGYLEDRTDPTHKATALTQAGAYAHAYNLVFMEYWDDSGARGKWNLSSSTNATHAWAAVSASQ